MKLEDAADRAALARLRSSGLKRKAAPATCLRCGAFVRARRIPDPDECRCVHPIPSDDGRVPNAIRHVLGGHNWRSWELRQHVQAVAGGIVRQGWRRLERARALRGR